MNKANSPLKDRIQYYGTLLSIALIIFIFTFFSHKIACRYSPQDSWYGALFMGVGLSATLGLLISFVKTVYFLAFSSKTTGIITAVKAQEVKFAKLSEVHRMTENPIHEMFIETTDTVYDVKFKFVAADGNTYYKASDRVQTTQKEIPGEERPVRYLRSNPNKAIIDTFFQKWAWVLAFLILSIVFSVIGFLMLTGVMK